MPVYGNPLEGSPQPVKVESRGGLDSEGPLWIASGGYLLFSSVEPAKIIKLDPTKPMGMRFSDFAWDATSIKTNGLALDADGNLIVCERSTGRVRRRKLDGGPIATIAETFNGKKFNAPNDVVVGKNGDIYFTDPMWGSTTGTPQPESAYRIAAGNMQISLVTPAGMKPTRPNGIALSPDNKWLYVGDDTGNAVWRYTVNADGSTGAGASWLTGVSVADGIAIDDAGNVYVTTSNEGGSVRVYKDDKSFIGAIKLPGRPSNASFGGADRKTLYMTVGNDIYSVQLKVPGLP